MDSFLTEPKIHKIQLRQLRKIWMIILLNINSAQQLESREVQHQLSIYIDLEAVSANCQFSFFLSISQFLSVNSPSRYLVPPPV